MSGLGQVERIPKVEADQVLLDPIEYNDLYIGLSGAKVPAANTPTFSPFTTNTKLYTFAVDDYIDLSSVEMLHGWKEGTPIEFHIHWVTNGLDATDCGVKWQIFYTMGELSAYSAEASASAETIIPAATADKTGFFTDIVTIPMTGYTIGTNIVMRLKRIAATATAPAANPFASMVGIHYQIESIGSRNIGSK